MLDLERYVNFLIDKDLSQRQFLFLMMMVESRQDLVDKYKAKYPVEYNKPAKQQKFLSDFERRDLIDKGYLIPVEGTDNQFTITEEFYNVFGKPRLMFNEILDIYPTYMVSDGKRFPLAVVNQEELQTAYAAYIFNSLSEHKEVMKDLKYGKDNGLLNLKLDSFIKSKYWTVLRKERLTSVKDIDSYSAQKAAIQTINLADGS